MKRRGIKQIFVLITICLVISSCTPKTSGDTSLIVAEVEPSAILEVIPTEAPVPAPTPSPTPVVVYASDEERIWAESEQVMLNVVAGSMGKRPKNLTEADLLSVTEISIHWYDFRACLGEDAKEEFTLTVLEALPNLDQIVIEDGLIYDLSYIKHFPELKVLQLTGETLDSHDLPAIQTLKKLEVLKLYICDESDLALLSGMTQLKELDLRYSDISDISQLSRLRNLEKLFLNGAKIEDVTPLKNLTNLEILNLEDNQITDVTPLKNLTNLKVLNLEDNLITDVTPLKGLANLEELYLYGNQELESIKAVLYFPNLRKFSVNSWIPDSLLDLGHISDLVSLKTDEPYKEGFINLCKLNSLETLIFADVNLDTDYSLLTGLKNLKRFEIYDEGFSRSEDLGELSQITEMVLFGDIKNLEGISTMVNLVTLDLHACQLTSIEGIENLQNLIELDISFDGLCDDFTPVSQLTNLRVLDIGDDLLDDIGFLGSLKKLEVLHLYYNDIDDLSPISNLTNLVELDISNNNITDLTPLLSLPNLKILDISGNPIADYSVLDQMDLDKLHK